MKLIVRLIGIMVIVSFGLLRGEEVVEGSRDFYVMVFGNGVRTGRQEMDRVNITVRPVPNVDHYRIRYGRSIGGGIGVGYRWGNFRVELQGRYNRHRGPSIGTKQENEGAELPYDFKSCAMEMRRWSVLVNGYYDMRLSKVLSVYFGGGLGITWLKVGEGYLGIGEDRFTSFKKITVCGQVMAGMTVRVTEVVELFGGVGLFMSPAPRGEASVKALSTFRFDSIMLKRRILDKVVEVGLRVNL